jgi:hypothetical protein
MEISGTGAFLFLDGVEGAASVELVQKIERLSYGALWVVETAGRDSLTYCAISWRAPNDY